MNTTIVTGLRAEIDKWGFLSPGSMHVVYESEVGAVGPYLRDTSNPEGGKLSIELAALALILLISLIILAVRCFK